jgi:serine/threonine protein kinase
VAEESKSQRRRRIIDAERWKKLETVFDEALAKEPEDRTKFLSEQCDGDEELQAEVQSLLDADINADGGFGTGAVDLYMKVMEQTLIDDTEPLIDSNIVTGMELDGRWKILESLDSGGMGDVYKAHDLRFPGRTVVVKILRKEHQGNPWKVKKFDVEGLIEGKIQHENVVTVFDRGTLPSGEQYLVMEFLSGRTLDQLIKDYKVGDRQIELPLIAEIMKQLGAGVAAIHETRSIHRDLKPLNIMVRQTSNRVNLKIIDFGIVRVLDRSTVVGQIVGSLFYMSPEQVKGEDAEFTSDIYSMAVIAYELITGRRPFDPQNHQHLHKLQVAGVKVKPSDLRHGVSPEADRLILNALSYKARRRPAVAQQFAEDLAHALSNAPESRRWRIAKLGRLILTVLAITILAVALWGLFAFLKRERPASAPLAEASTNVGSERALTYSLSIVRKRDGKTIAATGRETFDTGDEFRFSFTPAEAGALYVFNEGTSGNWNVLFPTRKNHQGNPQLAGLEKIETDGYEFTDEKGSVKGKERIWIVWASSSVQLLDEAVQQALGNELRITDPSQKEALDRFLTENSQAQPSVTSNGDSSQITLKWKNKLSVYRFDLEHMDWK